MSTPTAIKDKRASSKPETITVTFTRDSIGWLVRTWNNALVKTDDGRLVKIHLSEIEPGVGMVTMSMEG